MPQKRTLSTSKLASAFQNEQVSAAISSFSLHKEIYQYVASVLEALSYCNHGIYLFFKTILVDEGKSLAYHQKGLSFTFELS